MSLLDLWKCFRDGYFTFQLGFQVLSCWNHSQMNWWSPLGCSWHCLLQIKSLQLLCKFINVPVLNDNINTKQNSQFFLLKFGLWILPWNLRLHETEQDNCSNSGNKIYNQNKLFRYSFPFEWHCAVCGLSKHHAWFWFQKAL